MTKDTEEFIENWELKLSQINGNNFNNVYDKFITLFTIYNRYYNESYSLQKANNQLIKSRYSDFEKATSLVVSFLNAKNILDIIDADNNTLKIQQVCSLIENKVFNINLDNGQPQTETDETLLKNLKSNDVEIKAKAITSLIYNVRCNIVHGYKDFQEYQRLIVETLIDLLMSLIKAYKIQFIKI